MMFTGSLLNLSEQVLESCRRNQLRIAVAESCTGGLITGCLTAVAGSSDVVERGFVTYTNRSKTEMVGVAETLIETHGAVSKEVARAMAEGALGKSAADIALSATGVAGPGGGTEAKPVGLVHVAAAKRGGVILHERHLFPGGRAEIRLAAVEAVLNLARHLAEGQDHDQGENGR